MEERIQKRKADIPPKKTIYWIWVLGYTQTQTQNQKKFGFGQRSVIAQKLLLQLLLNFQYPITITKLFFVKKRSITITSAITVDNYNII